MKIDYVLPPKSIAYFPVKPRDHSKLLVLDRSNQKLKDHYFYELPEILHQEDILIFNNTRVEARRVFLRKEGKPTQYECLFLDKKEPSDHIWRVLIRGLKKIKDGDILSTVKHPNIKFRVYRKNIQNDIQCGVDPLQARYAFLEEPFSLKESDFMNIGEMPIPPYIKRKFSKSDQEDYQSVFATESGSSAAPTASLHFTEDILNRLKQRGIEFYFTTLHVGYGTFAPLREENFRLHKLHEEEYSLPVETAKRIQKKDYRRLIAVGTTTLRVLETIYRRSKKKFDTHLIGKTDIFLHPPDKINSVDALITNFHLPNSSLLLLVACMVKEKFLLEAYSYAISKEYRFFSYGDAMFIQ